MQKRQRVRFPKRFLWGVSTSAHQVEGGTHNQWSVWELENAKSLAAQASYQFGDLKGWSEEFGKVASKPENYVSGRAANHYELFENDLDLVRKLHMNAFRLSIEWSRIEPEQGAWQVSEVEHYKAVLAACKQRGIEPIVTLFHFTLPTWFAELGGFEKRRNVRYFVAFCEKIIRELGGSVKYVIIINEPEVYAAQSYYEGNWPPQKHSKRLLRRVLLNQALAHNQVADRLHKLSRRYKVSVAKNSAFVYPGDDAWLTVQSAAVMQYFQDDYFLRKVVKKSDFIGVNYYLSKRVYGYRVHNPGEDLNDMGWDMQPDDLRHVLERLSDKYKKPILITENGLADVRDQDRKWWLTQTILAMREAMDKGVDLIGYLHWSLLDNFEWDKGFWPRFGLFAVDYTTMKRTPRPSAAWLAKFLKQQKELNDGK